jgi:hypothetical protein
MRAVAISTTDNPYDPFDDFEEWYAYDERHGYHTCAYLDRSCVTSESLSEEENLKNIEDGIDSIILFTPIAGYGDDENDLVFYKKIIKEIPDAS